MSQTPATACLPADGEDTLWWRQHPVLTAMCCVALIVGAYARFKGLGKWPLAIDEYYFVRSVQNVLRAGLPEYLCGGFYVRGVFLQYLTALLQLSGFTPELAPRVIAAVSTLVTLPAAFILGRRLNGVAVGLLTVIVLTLSIWEIEVARFGRMYAPFQAVFAWYLVFFVRHTVDGDRRALWSMLALSVFGVFVWEGGVLLGLTNLLVPFLRHSSGRISGRDWRYLAATAVLLAAMYELTNYDFRTIDGLDNALPPGYVEPGSPPVSFLDFSQPLYGTLAHHPVWIAIGLLPLLLALNAIRWIWKLRGRWFAALGLLVALGTALLHQFTLVVAALVLLLLLRLLDWRELFARPALPFHAAVLSCALFWVAYGFSTSDWYASSEPGLIHVAGWLVYELVRFPNLIREVVVPWAHAVPLVGIVLGISIAALIVQTIWRQDRGAPSVESAVLTALVCLLLAVGASDPPRHETRYVFFLFPLAITIAVTVAARAVSFVMRGSQYAPAGVALCVLAGFAFTEDFQPYHLWNIDRREVNFRTGMSSGVVSHYHPRSDVRGAAQWLSQHAHPGSGGDLVISAYPGIEFYYRRFDYFFLDWNDSRFENYSCKAGTTERWSNLPLLDRPSELESLARPGGKLYLVTDRWVLDRLRGSVKRLQPQVVWRSSDGIWIVALQPR